MNKRLKVDPDVSVIEVRAFLNSKKWLVESAHPIRSRCSFPSWGRQYSFTFSSFLGGEGRHEGRKSPGRGNSWALKPVHSPTTNSRFTFNDNFHYFISTFSGVDNNANPQEFPERRQAIIKNVRASLEEMEQDYNTVINIIASDLLELILTFRSLIWTTNSSLIDIIANDWSRRLTN